MIRLFGSNQIPIIDSDYNFNQWLSIITGACFTSYLTVPDYSIQHPGAGNNPGLSQWLLELAYPLSLLAVTTVNSIFKFVLYLL